MFEEPISSILPSIWASMNSWFTPTVLFVLLNVMIGTIVVISRLATTHHHHHKPDDHHQEEVQYQQNGQHQQLARSPSMLQRLKSINFYNYRSQQEPTNVATFNVEKLLNQDQFEHTQFFTTTTTTSSIQRQLEHYQQQQEQQQPPLSRSPSMLQRLKSINIYNYLPSHQDSNFTTSTHKLPEISDTHFSQGPIFHDPSHEQDSRDTKAFDGAEEENEGIQGQEQTLEEVYSRWKGKEVSRTKSDTKPTSGEVPTKLSKKMKKSASTKSAFNHFDSSNEESEISAIESRRAATVREGKAKATDSRNVGDVDAQADDFINKFKQQLKLQRLDSIIRYKEMITRGSGK